MKRVMSMMLVVMLLISSTVVLAESKPNVNVDIIESNMDGNRYSFKLEYRLENAKQGDTFTIETPFSVGAIDGKEYADIVQEGNVYTFTIKDNFDYVNGFISGAKTIHNTNELKPIIVDGKVIKNEYPEVSNNDTGQTGELPEESMYKIGQENGEFLDWEIVVGANGEGFEAVEMFDEIGEGHEYVEGSISMYYESGGSEIIGEDNLNNSEASPVSNNTLKTSKNRIEMELKPVERGNRLIIKYKTRITNKGQVEFKNQLVAEGKRKVSTTVTIEGDSGIDGGKPTDPDVPNELPQVGESLLKIEYLVAVILFAIARKVRKS